MANIFLEPLPRNAQLCDEHSEKQFTDPCRVTNKQTIHCRIHLETLNILLLPEPIGDELEQAEDVTNDKNVNDIDDNNDDNFDDTDLLVSLK